MDCIESVDCFWQNGHFYYVNSGNPLAWEIFLSSEIFNLFLQRLEVLVIDLSLAWLESHQGIFTLFVMIVEGVVSLISFSACASFE